jgi:hypothetical protein
MRLLGAAVILGRATPSGPGVHVTSPGSGLARAGVVGVLAVGVGGMRTVCEGAVGLSGKRGAGLWLAKGNGGFVGQKSLALGTGPIDLSVSVAQSNLRGSFTVALCVV